MILSKYLIIFLLFLAWYQRNVSQFLTILKHNKKPMSIERERERERERESK